MLCTPIDVHIPFYVPAKILSFHFLILCLNIIVCCRTVYLDDSKKGRNRVVWGITNTASREKDVACLFIYFHRTLQTSNVLQTSASSLRSEQFGISRK